ncbi:OPA3-like protein [Camellia lanceoleosa]|uniref:OPA3-like protein n=1 Tax=Camellia lanceoleosa TaxID=1840588 RepID=A0ACC0ISR7_9ERIC|nr:OPA3-like protein [Camellia lanceoleosa]
MVLPLLKLGTLVLKTLSKPIASRLKKEAGKHPKFRKVIANHRLTTTMQRRIYGHATDVEIRPLNEEKAVQAAVDLLGEFFVFSVAGVALILEVQRSARSEAKKEELRKKDLEGMRQKDEELAKEIELLKKKLEELEQLARGQGLAGVFNIRHPRAEDGKSGKPA